MGQPTAPRVSPNCKEINPSLADTFLFQGHKLANRSSILMLETAQGGKTIRP